MPSHSTRRNTPPQTQPHPRHSKLPLQNRSANSSSVLSRVLDWVEVVIGFSFFSLPFSMTSCRCDLPRPSPPVFRSVQTPPCVLLLKEQPLLCGAHLSRYPPPPSPQSDLHVWFYTFTNSWSCLRSLLVFLEGKPFCPDGKPSVTFHS